MSFVFKKFFSQTLSDAAPLADLRRIAIEAAPTSERATRLRSIAQDVLLSVHSAKCIAVVPASSGNTSWLLANLAYALAETRHSICLVEANLRKPRLASVFNLPPSVAGLADVLQGKMRLDAAKCEINSNLTIIPGGHYPNDIVGLLASARLAETFSELSSTYALTLVSCPSAADYLDYSFISRCSEGAIIIAQKDKCRMGDAVRLRSEIDKIGVPLKYAVLATI